MEEVLPSIRNPAPMGFESCRAGECQEKPCELYAIAIAPLPNVLDIRNGLLLIPFLLLLGFSDFVGRVAYLLYAAVYLPQLYLRGICRRNNLRHRFVHRLVFSHEALQGAIPLLANGLPELIWVALQPFLVIDEIHTRLQFVFRRHEVFRLERCDIVRGHFYKAVRALLWLGALR